MRIKQETYEFIKKGADLLGVNAFDTGHDQFHHYKVWSNVSKILVKENLFDQVNIDALFVAAWWHDFDRKDKEMNSLKYNLKLSAFSEEFQVLVLKIVSEHSHDQVQTLTESKVLFDADKIEYVDPIRSYWMDLSIDGGKMSVATAKKYVEALNLRIENVVSKIYFNETKRLLKESIEEMLLFGTFFIKHYPESYEEMDFELLKNQIAKLQA